MKISTFSYCGLVCHCHECSRYCYNFFMCFLAAATATSFYLFQDIVNVGVRHRNAIIWIVFC